MNDLIVAILMVGVYLGFWYALGCLVYDFSTHPKQVKWLDQRGLIPCVGLLWPLALWLELYYHWQDYKVRCDYCGKHGATCKRQLTQYHDDKLNYKTLCPDCQEVEDAYWQEVWREYRREVL